MDEDRLRQIVAEHVRQVLQREEGQTPAPPPADGPNVLAVFCGGRAGLSTALAQVAVIGQHVHVTAVLTSAAKEMVGEQRLKKEARVHEIVLPDTRVRPWDLVARGELVLVAQLTRTTLARIATGLSDSPASTLVLSALWSGKPVVVAKDGVDPELVAPEAKGPADVPRALVRLYEEYLNRLETFGCLVIPAANISETVLAILTGREARRERPLQVRRVITEEDVRRAARRGEKLNAARAIVTPLARDTARELGVDLIET